MIQQNVDSVDAVPEVPKKLKAEIESDYEFLTTKVIKRTDASDGSTTKLLVQLQDGLCVESVIMRYGQVELDNFPQEERQRMQERNPVRGFRSNKRATLCVSSQVGCSMGCTFCGIFYCVNVSYGNYGFNGKSDEW
jgi:sorting nexin-8